MEENLRQLLLKDLCARLPYGVIIDVDGRKCTALKITQYGEVEVEIATAYYRYYFIDDVKPCLRPMSSMTEEEVTDFANLGGCIKTFASKNYPCILSIAEIDWLIVHHFDYRGLIEKGLAIAVTEENNPYKQD